MPKPRSSPEAYLSGVVEPGELAATGNPSCHGGIVADSVQNSGPELVTS